MGQGQSDAQGSRSVSTEELSHELAARFARKCFTSLELYSFKDVFKSLADTRSSISYWREDTLCRFLEIPDALGAGQVVYQSASYLGAFPFPSMAPCILDFETLLKVVVLMTERHGKILKKGNADRIKLLYRSLAVFDRRMSQVDPDLARDAGEAEQTDAPEKPISAAGGYEIDDPLNDQEDDDEDDDDELALAALDSLDAIEVFKHGEKTSIHQSQIPADNFRRLLMLLIVIAPLGPQESLSRYSERVSDGQLDGLRRTADSMLWAFGIEKHSGILYRDFLEIVPSSLPHLFDGLGPLFEHFLFSKTLDLSKRKQSSSGTEPPTSPISPTSPTSPTSPKSPMLPQSLTEDDFTPVLQQSGDILDLNLLSQLSFFVPPPKPFRRLRQLYSGSSSGFSMNSFETQVFNWRAPTIFLVSGTVFSDDPSQLSNHERAFVETLPPQKLPSASKGNAPDHSVIFGAYTSTPWKHTHRECFGSEDTLLFQLYPVHNVFHPSTVSKDYITFAKPPSKQPGIAFGCPVPNSRGTSSSASSSTPTRQLGPVSLYLDDALEYGVFTHVAAGGGSFHPSVARKSDWQTRFAIDNLEVWGVGGDEEQKRQKAAYQFEEREAERRRRINVGRGDVEADRALLEMAGLVGQHQSGGSV